MSLREEVKARVKEFVGHRFGGDYRVAFDHYDANKDGKITQEELIDVLRDAGVGNYLTRSVWARGAIRVIDADADGGVSWDEFQKALSS